MSTLFGEGSLVKKIITWVSMVIIILPIVAYSTVETVEAATYNNNADKYGNVDPSVPLKTTTRNPNNIVGLSMTQKKGVPVMRLNISASSNDVIKKGDRLDISLSKKNVDTNKIKQLAAQDNNSLYNITKKGNDLVINFKKDATSGNYQEVFAIATKNVKADTKASATFAGKSIKIDNNNINSSYRAPQKQQKQNQTQRTSNNQQSTNNQFSQQSSTQAASSSDGESQTASNGQQQTQTTQNGETQQQQSNQSDTTSPSFSQAESAVNTRTTIQVTGTATTDPTQTESNDSVTEQNQGTTNNNSTDAVASNVSDTNATETQANVSTDTATQSETQQPAANNVAVTTVVSSQTTTTENNATTEQSAPQSTFTPQEVSPQTSSTQASDNSGYIEIANQGYVAPKTTLDNYLTSDSDLDNNQAQNNEDNYEDNSQFEAIYGHVQQKATNASVEEVNEITKDLPSMWNYIGKNDSDSDTQGQIWRFHSTLSTGRDALVTIDGTAQPDSSDVLQQEMPDLLRKLGRAIEPGALNEAVDIDALKKSSIYQDYIDGKYTGPAGNNTANTSDVLKTVEDHTSISLDKPNNGADITELPNVAKVDPNVLLKNAQTDAKDNKSAQTTNNTDAESQATYDAIKQATYNKMTPWASDDEKAEMLKSVPTIWNDVANKTNKDDKVGQLYNYVLNGTDGRQIFYTIDGRIIPNGNKYEKQFPNVLVSLGKNMQQGAFDAVVNNDILRNSQAYQDYEQKSQSNIATTPATAGTAAATAPLAGGLGLLPLAILFPVIGAPLLLGGLALAPVATVGLLATAPLALGLALPVFLPILLALPVILTLPITIPVIALTLPLLLGAKLALLPIDLINTVVFSQLAAAVLTAPLTILNTIVGVGLGLFNTLIGSLPLAIADFIIPVILNFMILRAISHLVQLTLFNTLAFFTIAKALINGAVDLALALSFIGLPLALIKGLFDLFRLGLGLINALVIPLLASALTFLALLPIALLNTLLLTLFNSAIPVLLGFVTSFILSNLVGGLTFLALLGLKLLTDLIRNGFQLFIRLIAAATILVGLPLLIVAAQILNFFILLIANAVGGLVLWNLLTLAKSLMLAGLGLALFTLPLGGQFLINTLVKWSIRALIHIFRFFVGLFKVGARLVLSFVLGLLNAIAGLAKAASVITAVVSGIAAALTALIPVVGPVLALLPLLISLLSIANSLILTPIKFVLGLLNLLVLGLNLLAIPLYLFVRPLISIALALGAGLLSDLLMPVLTLPLVLFNQLTLFNLVFLPLLLLNLLGTFLIQPLLLGGLGLINALALPLIFALTALGLVNLLGLLLLSNRLPLIALALLALPSFIPFFNLIMDTIFLAPLVTLLLSLLNLFIGLPLMMLIDSLIDIVVPFIVWLTSMLLLAPIFGPLAFLNPLTWLNLPLVSLIGTFLTKLALKLVSLPILFFINGLISLIPAFVAAFIIGLLRALFGGLPFMLLAPLFLLPIILNGFLTALVPGLNLFTVPAALVAGLVGLPLALAGLLNNILGRLIWKVLSFVTAYLASNVLKDLIALVGVPLIINLLTPLILFNKFLTTQFLIFPALWLGLPLLAQLITSALLWGWTFIKGFAHVALDLFNIGATLLTLPLWTILPALNLLRRLALAFVALVSLPLRLLKDFFHIIRAIVEVGAVLLLPLLNGLLGFLILLPITTFNFLALRLFNVGAPIVLALLNTLLASLLINGLTFIAVLGLILFNKFLQLGVKLLILGAITLLILGALPIILGAAVLNFLLLAVLNAFLAFNAWLITTLINNLLVGAFLLGLLLIPLVSQIVINTVVKWTIRAIVHLVRFFVGLFRLGARLVLQFIIGLTNLVLGLAKGLAAIAAVVNLLLAPISLVIAGANLLLAPLANLIPLVGPFLALGNLIIAGISFINFLIQSVVGLLSVINFLILLPLKLLAGLINVLTLGGLLLSIPYWLFIRPLNSVLFAIGAGIISDIVMTLLSLPLVLFNTLTLFNLVGVPALLLKAFNNLVVLPLLLNGIGLGLAFGLPLALLLGALGLLNLVVLGLLGLGSPLLALILLSLPNLIPFLDLILMGLNFLGLFNLISSLIKLLLLPIKILLDLFNNIFLPLLVAGLGFLFLLPLLGVITFLNPLRWLNLGILSAIGTFLTKLLLGLLAIPFILVKNLLTSLIPAVLAGLLVGLLRALFGGLPFLLLALGLLLPLILNGLLTALIPGLNLLTVPLGLLALLLGLPLVTLGILNNLLKQLVWTVLGTIITQIGLNLGKDLLDLLLWLPLQLLLALPLFLLNLALNAFVIRPLLLFGLPLLAALLTNLALVAFNLIRRGLELLAELLTLGATLLTLPLWTILPGLNFLRRLLSGLMALRIARNLLVGALKMLALIGLPLLATLLFAPIAGLIGLGTFLALTALNIAIPFLLALGASILLGLAVQLLTTLALIGLDLLNKVLKNLLKLGLLALVAGFFFLVVVPLLILGKILNFLFLSLVNAFIGFNIWLLSSLAKSLALALLAGGLFLAPLLGKLALAAVTAIAIRALVHLIGLFVGLFKLGARLVLTFILGLLRNLNRLVKLANFGLAVLNAVLAIASLLLPVPGWLLAPLFTLLSLLNFIDWLFLIPGQLLLDLLGLLNLAGWIFLTIPYFLFVRPLIIGLLALGAGLLSHIISFLIGLPLFLLGQLLLQGLITLPLFLLKLFSIFVVAPLLINGLGLLLALGTSTAIFLALLNLPILLFNALLGLFNPLLAAILLGLPSLIPFLNLAMDLAFFVPLFLLLFNLLRLLLLPLKIFNDLIKNLLLPQLLFLLSLPLNLFLFGPFNPLNWFLAPALALLGTLLAQGLLRLLGLPFKLLLDALISLIPAALAGFVVGLLRALLGGLPFLTLMNLALLLPGLLLLPLIINGILTALIPGLNLLTVPLAILAALLNLPVLLGLLLSGLGILRNLLSQLFWGLLANVFTYFLSNLILDALAIVLIPLLLNVLGLLNFLPLTLFNLLFAFPFLLGLGLPLLAMLLNQLLLSIFNALRRLGKILLDLFNIGLTLLASPLWLLLPALHFLRRLMFWLNALVLVPLAFLKKLIDIGRQILHAIVLVLIPLALGLLAGLLALPLALPINLLLKAINLAIWLPLALFNAFGPVLISILLNRLLRRLFALAVIGLSIINYFLLFNLFLPFKLLQLLVNFNIIGGQILAFINFWNINPILIFNDLLVDGLLFGIKVLLVFNGLAIANFVVGLLGWLPMVLLYGIRLFFRIINIFILPLILVAINVAIVEFITMIVANIALFLLHLLEDLPFTIIHLLGLGFVVLSFIVQLLGLLPIGLAFLLTILILPLAPLGLLNVLFTGFVWFNLVAINIIAVFNELIAILIRIFAVPGIWLLRLLITPIEVIAIMLLNLVLTPAFLATIFWFQVGFNALLTVFPLIIWAVANSLFIYPVLANVLGFVLAFYASWALFLITDIAVLFINRALIIFNTINYMWHSLLTLPAILLVGFNWLLSNLMLLGVPLLLLAGLIAPLLAGLLGFLLAFPIAWIGIQLMQWFTTPLWLAIIFQIIAFNDFIFNNITNAITVWVMHAVITLIKGLNLFILGKTIFDVLTTGAVILRLLTLANLLLMLAGIFTLVINPLFNRPLVSFIAFKIFNPWTAIFDLVPSLAAYFVYYLGTMYAVSNAMWPGVWLLMTLALPVFIRFMTFTYSLAMPITIPINLAIQAISWIIPILAVFTPTIFLLPNFFNLIPIFRYLINPFKLAINFYKNALLFGLLNILPTHVLLNLLNPINLFMYVFIPIQFIGNMTMQLIFWIACTIVPQFRMGISATEIVLSSMLLVSLIVAPLFFNSLIIGQLLFGWFPILKGLLGGTILDKLLILHDFIGIFVAPLISNPIMFVSLLNMGLNAVNIAGRLLTPWWMTPIKMIDMVELGMFVLLPGINAFPSFGNPFFWSVINFAISFKVFVIAATLPLILFPGKLFRDFWAFNLFNFAIRFVVWNALITNSVFLLFILRIWQFIPLDLLFALVQFPAYTLGHFFFRILLTPIAAAASFYLLNVLGLPLLILNNLIVFNWILFTPLTIINILLPVIPLAILIGVNFIIWAFRLLWTTAEILLAIVGGLALLISPLFSLPVVSFILEVIGLVISLVVLAAPLLLNGVLGLIAGNIVTFILMAIRVIVWLAFRLLSGLFIYGFGALLFVFANIMNFAVIVSSIFMILTAWIPVIGVFNLLLVGLYLLLHWISLALIITIPLIQLTHLVNAFLIPLLLAPIRILNNLIVLAVALIATAVIALLITQFVQLLLLIPLAAMFLLKHAFVILFAPILVALPILPLELIWPLIVLLIPNAFNWILAIGLHILSFIIAGLMAITSLLVSPLNLINNLLVLFAGFPTLFGRMFDWLPLIPAVLTFIVTWWIDPLLALINGPLIFGIPLQIALLNVGFTPLVWFAIRVIENIAITFATLTSQGGILGLIGVLAPILTLGIFIVDGLLQIGIAIVSVIWNFLEWLVPEMIVGIIIILTGPYLNWMPLITDQMMGINSLTWVLRPLEDAASIFVHLFSMFLAGAITSLPVVLFGAFYDLATGLLALNPLTALFLPIHWMVTIPKVLVQATLLTLNSLVWAVAIGAEVVGVVFYIWFKYFSIRALFLNFLQNIGGILAALPLLFLTIWPIVPEYMARILFNHIPGFQWLDNDLIFNAMTVWLGPATLFTLTGIINFLFLNIIVSRIVLILVIENIQFQVVNFRMAIIFALDAIRRIVNLIIPALVSLAVNLISFFMPLLVGLVILAGLRWLLRFPEALLAGLIVAPTLFALTAALTWPLNLILSGILLATPLLKLGLMALMFLLGNLAIARQLLLVANTIGLLAKLLIDLVNLFLVRPLLNLIKIGAWLALIYLPFKFLPGILLGLFNSFLLNLLDLPLLGLALGIPNLLLLGSGLAKFLIPLLLALGLGVPAFIIDALRVIRDINKLLFRLFVEFVVFGGFPGILTLAKDLILGALALINGLLNIGSLLNLINTPLHILGDLLKNFLIPLLATLPLWFINFFLFNPLNPFNWLLAPLLAGISLLVLNNLLPLILVPLQQLLNKALSLIPALLAGLIVPLLRGLLGGLPVDLLGKLAVLGAMLGLPLLNLAALIGLLVPFLRLLALPLLVLTQLAALPMLLLGLPLLGLINLDILRNLLGQLIWNVLTFLAVYPIALLINSIISRIGLRLLRLLLFLPLFLFNLFFNNLFLIPLLGILVLPLIAKHLLRLAMNLFGLAKRLLNLFNSLLGLGLTILTMPLWFFLPLLNILRRVAFWLTLLVGVPLDILRRLIKLLFDLFIGNPLKLLALVAIPAILGLGALALALPLLTALLQFLLLPLLAKLLLPLVAILLALPIKLLLDLLALPLLWLANRLLSLLPALALALILPIILSSLLGLLKLPFDLLELLGLPLLQALTFLNKILALLNPLLWPLLPLLFPTWWILGLLSAAKLLDVFKDILGPLATLLLDNLVLLAIPLIKLLINGLELFALINPLLWPLLFLVLIPLGLTLGLLGLPIALFNVLKDLFNLIVPAVLTFLIASTVLHLINGIINLFLIPLISGLLTLPLRLLNFIVLNALRFPLHAMLLPALIGLGVTALLGGFLPLLGLGLAIPVALLDGLRFLLDDLILGALLLPGLIPFRNLLLNLLFFIPLLLNLISLFNLLRTPLKWILDIFNQLALPLAAMALTFAILIPFFGLISLLNPFKWLRMALLSALTTFNVQLLSTLILLPLKLLNNKLLSFLPALLNGLLLGFLRNILGGLPLDILGLLALPLLNLMSLLGLLVPGLRLLALPLLLLTQLLGLPLLLDTLRNLLAPLLWGNLAGLLTYPIANLIKNALNLLGLPLLGLLATLPIFLLKLFNKAFVLRPLLLLGLPLLAQLLTGLALPLFNLIRRAIKLGLNLLKNVLALLTMPLWLGLPALNLLRELLILPVLLLTLLRGLRNLLNLFLGLPLLLLGLPLLAGLATLLLGLPLLTLLNMLLSMPLLALVLPLLAALLLLPIKILLDLLLLPLVLLANKLLGLPMAILAGLLLPLLIGRMIRHLIKLPLDLLKLVGLVLFNLLLPFIPLLNILTPLLWPLGLLLIPLALADVLRDIFGNLPFDLLNLLLLPLITLLAGLALLIPGLGLLLAPILLPLILFNLLLGIPLALIRTIGDLAKLLLLALPLALLTTLLLLPLINLLNDVLSILGLPLLSGLLTLPLFLINLAVLTLLTFPIAKGVLPFLIANGLSALIANFLPVLIGLLLNPIIVLANGIRLFNDFIKTLNRLILLGLLALPGLVPFLDLFLDGLFLIPALINGLSLLNLLSLPFKFLRDLLRNNLLPLLLAGLLNLLLLPIFGPLQFLNPINWLLVPALAALRTFNTKLLAKLILVPGLILLNLLTSLIPATIAALVVPLLRSLLGGLPLDILGLLGLPLLNLLALLGTLIPGIRLLALPLLLLTQLLGLPLLLDTLRNLIAPLLWGALAGLLTYPIANLVKDALALLGLPLFDLLTFLPIFLFKLVKNIILGNLLHLGLPLLAQALTFLALVPLNLLRAGLKFLRNILPLALALLTMPLWFNLPLLNILRRVAFWLLLGWELLTLPFKLLRDLLRLVGLPLLLLGLPLLAGLLNFLLVLPLVTLAMMLLALPLPLTLLLPLLALLGNLPIKLLTDLLLLPLMLLGNALLALPLVLLLGNLLPLVLGALNGLLKLPFDLLKLLALPLLQGLVFLGKLFALLNPLLWPLLPLLFPLWWTLGMLIPFRLADVLKDILGPLFALPIDLFNALAIPVLGLLTLFWPLLPLLLPLLLTLGLVGTPLALLRVLKDLLKLALPILAALLLFPIIHTGLNILGLLALPLISGLLTLPLFLLNLGLKTLITLPIVKAILPILINLGILLAIANLPVLLLIPFILLRNLVKALRLLGDIIAILLFLPGALKDLFDLVILPLKILIKPLLVLGLPLVAKVLTFLALLPLMLLNNLLAHLFNLLPLGLIALGNVLLPLLIPFLLMNLLVRPLMIPGLMLLNGLIIPALLKLALLIPLLGLLALPFIISLLALPLFLLSLPFPLFNLGLQLLSLGMIIPGIAMVLGGLIALPVGFMNLLNGSTGTPGVAVPGTPGNEGNEIPEVGNTIREIPSVGFWVHNDPLIL